MTAVLIALVVVLAVALAALASLHFSYRARRGSSTRPTGSRRILFPFVGEALSSSALDAALRLASAEEATLVPVFLARVSLQLPIETPLPRQSSMCLPLQEAIEQRAAKFDVPVDARIERGRSYRHALRQAIAKQRFDRIVIAASDHNGPGFGPDDVRWLLDNAPGEIVVLRSSSDERLEPPETHRPRRARTRTRTLAVRERARRGSAHG
jgi:nucleotide-binding universal stress UspA family protein